LPVDFLSLVPLADVISTNRSSDSPVILVTGRFVLHMSNYGFNQTLVSLAYQAQSDMMPSTRYAGVAPAAFRALHCVDSGMGIFPVVSLGNPPLRQRTRGALSACVQRLFQS
jgi:hypothetical protein